MRYCWVWNVKKEFLKEYVEMHLNPWQEILDEHSRAGIRNYSIFQNDNQFIYVFECDDVTAAFEYIDNSQICQKWNAVTSKMVEGSFDFGQAEPISFLNEVFYLK